MKKLIDYKLEVWGNTILFQILDMDESQRCIKGDDGLIFKASNGVLVGSLNNASISKGWNGDGISRVFLRGESKGYDLLVNTEEFKTPENANSFAEKIKFALDEWQENGGFNECKSKQVERFKPKSGERYYLPEMTGGSFGSVVSVVHSGNYQDICDINVGRCYRTAKEAFDVFMCQKAIVRVNDAIEKANDGWVPNWSDFSESKVAVLYSYEYNKFEASSSGFNKRASVLKCCKSRSVANRIIEEYQDDLKLIFGVEK